MSPEARIRKARTLLAEGSRAFDADDVREGSRLMWEAAKSGIVAVAEQRGWPYRTRDDLRHVIYHLDHDGENPPMEVDPLTAYYRDLGDRQDRISNTPITEDDEWDYDGEFRKDPAHLKYSQKSIQTLARQTLRVKSPDPPRPHELRTAHIGGRVVSARRRASVQRGRGWYAVGGSRMGRGGACH